MLWSKISKTPLIKLWIVERNRYEICVPSGFFLSIWICMKSMLPCASCLVVVHNGGSDRFRFQIFSNDYNWKSIATTRGGKFSFVFQQFVKIHYSSRYLFWVFFRLANYKQASNWNIFETCKLKCWSLYAFCKFQNYLENRRMSNETHHRNERYMRQHSFFLK